MMFRLAHVNFAKRSSISLLSHYHVSRCFAIMVVKTPTMTESITEGILSSWEKKPGDVVMQDEIVANIETDKINLPVNSPKNGIIETLLVNIGDKVVVGSDLFKLDVRDDIAKLEKPKDVKSPEPKPQPQPSSTPLKPSTQSRPITTINTQSQRSETKTKLTPMRQKISQRLKESQNIAASLTTFNEVDMSAIMDMKSQYKDEISKKYNIKLGFMSAFIKASATVLGELSMVNSRIEGSNTLVTPSYIDISVAVATPKGLVTPVIRDCQNKDMIQLEQILAELGEKARQGQITMEDLSGGTFTISNGGVFGSLMGTPIINTPQSAILGMHAIKDRPIVVNGQVVSRPMMYLALTYDHRIIDGREAVTFLVRLKNLLEDPRRLLLNI